MNLVVGWAISLSGAGKTTLVSNKQSCWHFSVLLSGTFSEGPFLLMQGSLWLNQCKLLSTASELTHLVWSLPVFASPANRCHHTGFPVVVTSVLLPARRGQSNTHKKLNTTCRHPSQLRPIKVTLALLFFPKRVFLQASMKIHFGPIFFLNPT